MTTENEKDYDYSEFEESSGWALFAGVMIFGIGIFAAIAVFVELLNPSVISEYSMLDDKLDWIWYGIFDGLMALLAFYAGYAILDGKKIGYWLGLIMATLSAGRWFLFVPGFPLWSLSMVGLWLLVVYGLIKDRKYFV